MPTKRLKSEEGAVDTATGSLQQQPEAEPAPSQAQANTGDAGSEQANGDVKVCPCCRGDS